MVDADLAAFARLADALRPWLEHLVIVGGWSHRLYRLHELAAAPGYSPLLTKDADVAIPRALGGNIRAALASAGFEEVLVGEHTPPVAEYRLRDGTEEFFAEFLTPLAGSGVTRKGTSDATVVSAGVTAQKLRHLDILLVRPSTVRLDDRSGFPIEPPAEVRISNPVSFIAQKLLIRAARPPRKRAQDALYIHDTLELFGARLDTLRAMWLDDVRPALSATTARTVERLGREQFDEVDDILREAARIPLNRSLTPVRIRDDCVYGLEAIFGRSG